MNLYCHETVPVILQFSSNTLFNQSINDMNIDTNNRSNQLVSRSHYDIKGSVSQTYTFQVFPSDSIQNVNRTICLLNFTVKSYRLVWVSLNTHKATHFENHLYQVVLKCLILQIPLQSVQMEPNYPWYGVHLVSFQRIDYCQAIWQSSMHNVNMPSSLGKH